MNLINARQTHNHHVTSGRGTPYPTISNDADNVSKVSMSLSMPDNTCGNSRTNKQNIMQLLTNQVVRNVSYANR